ncbi:MAG: RNA polymerase sigma factor [Ignavibacteriales bacterium]|nr:RNA polymerase sigma factor [Ignavibacteriales bacterium]
MNKNLPEQNIEKISITELFDRFSTEIYRYSFSILKDYDEASDAVQETFVKFAENEESFKGQCSYKTWLIIIARNYCYNRRRSGDFKSLKIDEENFNESYELQLDWRISLKNALMKLTDEQNELIYLVDYAGYSYKEIAELTKQSLENIKIKIFRARQELRKYLKER